MHIIVIIVIADVTWSPMTHGTRLDLFLTARWQGHGSSKFSELPQTSYCNTVELIRDPVNHLYLRQRWLGVKFLFCRVLLPEFFVKTQLISTNNAQVNWNYVPRSQGHLRSNIGEFISRSYGIWVEMLQNLHITFGPHVLCHITEK